MFRNRHFLFGLGAGLILGALLLQLMNASDIQKSKLNTIDQMNGEEKLYTQADVDKLVNESRENNQGNAGQGSTAKADGAAGESSAIKQEAVPLQQGKKASEKAEEADTVEINKQVIRIKSGTNLTATAALLKYKGVIRNQQAFITLMKDASDKIQVGFFFFDGKLTPEQVKTIITSPPFAK